MILSMTIRVPLFLGLVFLFTPLSANAGIAVGGNAGAAGYAPMSGTIYGDLRDAIETQFSSSTFTTLTTLTGNLSSYDLLVLNRFQSTPLTAAEQTAVYNYVLQGGNLVYVGDAAELPNDSYTEPFGIMMVPDPAVPTGLFFADYTNPTHPYLTGPFLAPIARPSGGAAAKVSVLGPSVELAKWAGGGVAISAFEANTLGPGAGFGLFFTDVNMFTLGRYSDEVGPVVANALAAIPEPAGLSSLVGVLGLLGLRSRKPVTHR